MSQLALADTPNAVPWARRHAVDILRRWQVPSDVIEAARLIVSELTGNAVRHPGRNEPQGSSYLDLANVGTFSLTLQLTSMGLLVQVGDRDPRPLTRKQVGVDATGGRGLFLVDVMADRWGYYPTPTGKVVWAELLPHFPRRAKSAAANGARPGQDGEPDAATAATAPPLLMGRVLVGLREL
ncbi:ATP-binding protein [Streptomyces sp. NPDC001674]|uniref:ATP-binding protein n=1 Tax=Streptomyces sp. NPDC001674 TaxID=3154394 RepID=UPI003319AD17